MSTCPNGSIASLSDPSQCYSFETQKLNFMAAEQYCIGLGGNLVSIHNMFDNIFISGEASTFFTDSASFDFWIGGNNLYKPRIWTWMDQTSFDFNDWDKGQPQNTSGNGCVAAQMQGGRWIADDCFKTKSFVCLKATTLSTILQTTTTKKIPPTTTKKAKTCDNEWTRFGDFCYKVFDPRTWYEAEQMCGIEGAHLVSIHNTQEALFVANLAYYPGSNTCDGTKQAWVGLFTDNTFETYKWTDGTPFDYQRWADGNPYKVVPYYCYIMSLAPICVSLTGSFYAEQCDTMTAKFVCKKYVS